MPIDELKQCHPDLFTLDGINFIYRSIVHDLINIGVSTVSVKRDSVGPKFWWNNSLNDLKKEQFTSHKAWLDNGKPKFGPHYIQKLAAKKRYKAAIFKCRTEAKASVTDRLQENLVATNTKHFWKIWKSSFKSKRQEGSINGLKSNIDIANLFADSFQKACTPNDINKHNEF